MHTNVCYEYCVFKVDCKCETELSVEPLPWSPCPHFLEAHKMGGSIPVDKFVCPVGSRSDLSGSNSDCWLVFICPYLYLR